jgi:hypothetical protein
MTEQTATKPWVIRWQAPTEDHPAIVELKEHAGEWGVLQTDAVMTVFGDNLNEAVVACRMHGQVVVEAVGRTIHAKYLTEQQYAERVAEELAKPGAPSGQDAARD